MIIYLYVIYIYNIVTEEVNKVGQNYESVASNEEHDIVM